MTLDNENNITFKLNSEIKYMEDDMFRDLKKREAKRNPVTESFNELTEAFDNNKIEFGGNGLSVNRYMFMESEEELTAPPDESEEGADENKSTDDFEDSSDEGDEENSSEDISHNDDDNELDNEQDKDPEDSNESNDEGTASDSGEDDKTVDNSVDNSTDSTDTEADIDSDERLKSFGKDTSDIQNEYNTKDVDILNKLIASESEAINDYFDGAKDCNNETLRRLYGDIGHEERFHLEQLLYAKSTLTGERYEPRDPDVKREYEELVKMGMDEETAASTAIDKTQINSAAEDISMDKLAQEAAFVENSLIQNNALTSYCFDIALNGRNSYNSSMTRPAMIIMEAFIQEEMTNVAQMPKEVKKIPSPFKLLYKGLKASINGLIKLSETCRDAGLRNRAKWHMKQEWIKKHGIKDLFKSGIYLFFYDDKSSRYDIDTPCIYVNLLYQLTKKIGEKMGIRLTKEAQHKNIKNAIQFSNIDEGMLKLKNAILNKTKVIVNDNNEDMLIREFFGYSDQKINVAVQYEGDKHATNPSANIYNRLDMLIKISKEYMAVSEEVLEQAGKLEGDMNSIFYKDRKTYNKYAEYLKTIVDKYGKYIACMAHDLKVIYSFDDGILKMTQDRDSITQSGGTWTGDDIRVQQGNQAPPPNRYANKKKGLFK